MPSDGHDPGPVNDRPTAVDDPADGCDTVAEGGVLADAFAPGVLRTTPIPTTPHRRPRSLPAPAHASSLALDPDGTFPYVDNGSETTSDSLTYTAYDGEAHSNAATVTITVTPVDDPPVALPAGPTPWPRAAR